jgi:hypothetical protein
MIKIRLLHLLPTASRLLSFPVPSLPYYSTNILKRQIPFAISLQCQLRSNIDNEAKICERSPSQILDKNKQHF